MMPGGVGSTHERHAARAVAGTEACRHGGQKRGPKQTGDKLESLSTAVPMSTNGLESWAI